MSRVLTGDKLVESIRNRAMIPDDTSVYTDQDLLDIANEEMDVQVLDKLMSIHEEHLTVHIEIPRNEDGVYDIPYRAVGNKVRDVVMVTSGKNIYEMSQISVGSLSDYTFNSDAIDDGMSKFYVEHNQIKLVNPNRGYESIRFYFHIRPNVLTKLEKSAKVSSITEVGDDVTLTFTEIPKEFTASLQYDVVGFRTPNKIKAYDLDPVSIDVGLKTLTFKKEDIGQAFGEIRVGDFICKAEESPVPNIPTEMHPYLAQLVAVYVLEALGDSEGLNNAEKKLTKMEKAILQLVDDRVELSPKKIKPRNGVLDQVRVGRFGRRRGR